jgi:hypothetical protein
MSFLRDKNLPTYYFCLANLLWYPILPVVIVVENEETLLYEPIFGFLQPKTTYAIVDAKQDQNGTRVFARLDEMCTPTINRAQQTRKRILLC